MAEEFETQTSCEEQGQVGQQQQHQQGGKLRQVVVKILLIATRVELWCIVKLAVSFCLFTQDGSLKWLYLFIFFASLIELLIKALAPLIRWLSKGMQRVAASPGQQARPVVRPADNIPAAAARQENENAPLAGILPVAY